MNCESNGKPLCGYPCACRQVQIPDDSKQTWVIQPNGEIHTLAKCGLATSSDVKTINGTDVLYVEFAGSPPEKHQIWGQTFSVDELLDNYALGEEGSEDASSFRIG